MGNVTFNVKEYLDSVGGSIDGVIAPGRYKVTVDGREGEFNALEYIKSKNLDPKAVNLEVNDKDTAFDTTSPVGFIDRAKLALGNEPGKLKYLRNKFEAADTDAEGNLVVKDGGVWKRVDPSAAELSDFADLADVAVYTGTALAAAPTVAGAAAAGAVGSGIKTILGKAAGTYAGDEASMLKDAVLDAVISGVGQKVMLGASNSETFKAIKEGISGFAKNSSNAVKDIVSGVLHVTSGAQRQNVTRVFERPEQVNAALDALVKKGFREDSILEQGKRMAVDSITETLDGAQKALSSRYAEGLVEVVQTAPKTVTANISGVFDDGLKAMESTGILKLATDSSGEFLVPQLPKPAEFVKLMADDGMLRTDAVQAYKTLQDFVGVVTELGRSTKSILSGGKAVKAVIDAKKSLDSLYYSLPENMQRMLTPFTRTMRERLTNSLSDDGVKAQVAALSNFYSAALPSVKQAERIMRAARGGSAETVEAFASKFLTDPSSHQNAKGLIRAIGNLKENKGLWKVGTMDNPIDFLSSDASGLTSKAAEKVFDTVAALDFVRYVPKAAGGLSSSALAGAAVGTAVVGPGALAAAPIFSPRILARGAKGVSVAAEGFRQARNTMLSLGPKGAMEILKDPEKTSLIFGAALRGLDVDDEAKQLLEQGLQQ